MKLNGFAEACYENTIEELEYALAAGPDKTDMATWGISKNEWKAAIEAAIRVKMEDWHEDFPRL